MYNKQLLFIAIFSILGFTTAYTQAFLSGKGDRGIGGDLTLDPFNNLFTTNQFSGTTNVGTDTFTSVGSADIIVSKYNPGGARLWSTQIGGSGGDYARELAYDNNGNIWVSGTFNGTMNIAGYTLTSVGSNDGFVVKISATTGNVLFAFRFGSTFNDDCLTIKADPSGNIYLSGTFTGAFYAGSLSFFSLGMDVFVMKLDNNGTPQWLTGISGSGIETMWTMCVDQSGNVFVGGFGTSATTSHAGSNIASPGQNHFITKINSSGVHQWTRLMQFTGEIYGLSADGAGNVYFTGNFDTQAVIGPFTLTNGANDNILLVKIYNNGTVAWATHFGSTGSDQGYDLKARANGDLYLTGSFEGVYTFGSTILSGGGSGRTYIAKLDSSANVDWIVQSSTANLNYPTAIAVDNNGAIYTAGVSGILITFGNISINVPTNGGFLIKIADDANIINGTVFRDFNNDGIQNSGETGIPNSMVMLNSGPYAVPSNQSGLYNLYTLSGAFSASIPNLPLYHSLTTNPVQTANFSGLGAVDTANHFGLYPTPNVNDLFVDIQAMSVPKAGYALGYMITYKNLGTTAQNATLSLDFDPMLGSYVSSPLPSSVSGQTMTWNLGNLDPQIIGTINISFSIPTTANIGDSIRTVADISPVANDTTPANNNESALSIVVGPFDPNYKEVDKTVLSSVSNPAWLEYVVHFQNVGNDTAYNVYILDSITSYLDLSSMEIISKSHEPMTWSVNRNNIVEFRFDGIMLPDSATNYVGSSGFVKYRIKHLSTIPLNDSITNFADIYFDYNAPITTNTVATYYISPSAVDNPLESALKIYPNPVNDLLVVETEENFGGVIQLFDLNGRLLLQKTMSSNIETLDMSNHPGGIYFVQFKTDSGKSISKKITKK
jgi:hypothetical protein